ncbi:MAG: UDP-N-acetylglucosamine--N-acetylmuramyl-(pentapeptide) pyrophosphoryl-undecaprenol N-acetylglucosamine transferase [Pseudomonadota bacterium]|nr:UDP-N-acetylglucosamine--N-acetylmuramyl-(pentapeptide) pyrophosphoryl-undecaprenol N-acetylglucosamine transferase [Pseudomonadota bacterium]
MKIIFAFVQAVHLVLKLKPSIVVGFGGYPSFAPALAAQVLGRQVLIHEQNAVLGRANRVLCGLGAHLATSFGGTRGISKSTKTRTRKVGNPVRNDVLTAARGGYRYLNASRPFELLIFGGSQGASVFADTVPAAIGELPADLKARLRVVHQVRRTDMAQTLAAYGEISVYAEIRDFFDDLPARMRRAHLVICRGGASTVCELSLLGAPAIIVPLPGSLDQDQAHNVRELNEKGGAWMVSQTEFTTEWLSGKLNELMLNIELLNAASARSLSLARPDADLRLCRYALSLIKSDSSAGKEKKQ